MYAWNTNPTLSLRSCVRRFSSSVDRSTSPISTFPSVSRSSPAMQCRSVDLPDPDGPMIAVKRPVSKSTVMPSRALTAASPSPYTFTASTARAAARTFVSVVSVAIIPPRDPPDRNQASPMKLLNARALHNPSRRPSRKCHHGFIQCYG